jgi:chaperonin cofactor prefoldin
MRGTEDGDVLTEAEKEQLLHELDDAAEHLQARLDDNDKAVKTAMG